MIKFIQWTGKTTDGSRRYTSAGNTFKEIYEDIQNKYSYDAVIDADAFEIALLRKNNEDLGKYDITTDGLGNYALFEDFFSKSDIKHLTDEDYRDIIEMSDSQAYYQTFDVSYYISSADVDRLGVNAENFDIYEDSIGYYVDNEEDYNRIQDITK